MKTLNKNQIIIISAFTIATIIFLAWFFYLIVTTTISIYALKGEELAIKTELVKQIIVSFVLNIITYSFFYCSFLWVTIKSFKKTFNYDHDPFAMSLTANPPLNIISFRIISTILTVLLLCNIGSFIWGIANSLALKFDTPINIINSAILINASYILALIIIYSFYFLLAKVVLKQQFFIKKKSSPDK